MIAAVLLIAFTVAIATLIMGWFSTITRSTTTTVSNKTSEAVACSNAQVSIEDVYIVLNSTNGVSRVVVKNTGYTTLGITSLQIFNTTGNNFSTGFATVASFPSGSIQSFTITAVSIPTCASFSKALVTTNCGGIADTFDGTPKCT